MVALSRLEAYVAGLPCGLDSFPECQQKGSVWRGFIDGLDLSLVAAHVPRELRVIIEERPPASSWISEVKATALYLAIADCVLGDDGFVQHAYDSNIALLDSPMYRILFRIAGEQRVVSGVSQSWAMFHRGTSLSVCQQRRAARSAMLELSSPALHVPRLLARAYGTAFRAALELAGPRTVRVNRASQTDTTIQWAIEWE